MIQNYISFTLNTFRRRKLRSGLTILGILIGIASVVVLIALSQGLNDSIKEQLSSMGTDKILISPGEGSVSSLGMASSSELTDNDLEIIKKVQNVDLAGGYVYGSARIKFKDETKYTIVIGMPMDESKEIFNQITSFKIEKGSAIEKDSNYDANIGYSLKQGDFFDDSVEVQDKIYIEGKEFKVIGTIVKIGNPKEDAQIDITLDKAREIFSKEKKLDMIVVKVKSEKDLDKTVEDIKDKLRDYRNEKEGEETFSVITFQDIIEKTGSILGILTAILIAIAAISLLVGGIGVMNTMFTGVLERTREIGIMKAIGAKNSDILLIFLIESGIYGLIGGVLGIILGFLMGKGVEIIAAQSLGSDLLKISFPLWLIFGALMFSFVVGAVSGLAPAKRASKLNPVDALRYE